jgi:hypothetical protein
MRKTYWEILLDLWSQKDWIDNEDFRKATHGSPKLTSRISDMRRKGVEIISARRGTHFVYALMTDADDARAIMKRRGVSQ